MRPGYSMLETLSSLLILAVLVGAAGSSIGRAVPRHRLDQAVWEVTTKMNFARFKSAFEGVKFRVVFHPDGYSIDRFEEETGEWRLQERGFLSGVRVEANNSPVFLPVGTVSGLASIILSNGWGGYKITLAITGRIKVVKL